MKELRLRCETRIAYDILYCENAKCSVQSDQPCEINGKKGHDLHEVVVNVPELTDLPNQEDLIESILPSLNQLEKEK